jgi:hypothetical protein
MEYWDIDFSPVSLLSNLYSHLDAHFERNSPTNVRASLAFLLSTTSREYLSIVCRSVGISVGSDSDERAGHGDGSHMDEQGIDIGHASDRNPGLTGAYPVFFSSRLKTILPVAQKSYALFRAAHPHHQLLKRAASETAFGWFWPKDDKLTVDLTMSRQPDVTVLSPRGGGSVGIADLDDQFAQFRVFDQQPGSQIVHPLLNVTYVKSAASELDRFIANFPDLLPGLVPTLSHLADVVFEPLLDHAVELSKTLLSLFLSPSAPVTFQSQLELLQQYFLLRSNQFRTKLEAALFSDSELFDWALVGSRVNYENTAWPIGLAPALLSSGWPPVGSELSFRLRTIIVDSFEIVSIGSDDEGALSTLLEERENRLGFAIRDLTKGGKWQNPLCTFCISAYMKPTHGIFRCRV